jgi:hypothetical protein
MAIAHVSDEISKWGLDQKLSFDPPHILSEKLPRRSKVKVTKFKFKFSKIIFKKYSFFKFFYIAVKMTLNNLKLTCEKIRMGPVQKGVVLMTTAPNFMFQSEVAPFKWTTLVKFRY